MKTNKAVSILSVAILGLSLLAATATTVMAASTSEPEAKAANWREDYAYNLGMQAYVFSYPWVYLPELRYAWWVNNEPKKDVTFYMGRNEFWHSRSLITADYRDGGSPNNDTLYSMSIIDVSKEPVILSHPDMGDRYFTFELASATSDNFAYVGNRTTGGKAGHFLIAGPNWDGKIPKGVQLPAQSAGTADAGLKPVSPTGTVWMFGRTATRNPQDAKLVNKLQDQYKITPLSLWGKPDAKLPPSDHNTYKPYDRKTDPLADWKTINREMTANPPMAMYSQLIEQFKTVGIGPGQDVTKMDPATQKGLARAAKDGFAQIQKIGRQGGSGKIVNGWFYPPKTMGSAGYFNDLVTRAAIQCAMGIISNDPEEAVYVITTTDKEGVQLNGANSYTMTFKPGEMPNVKYFWSLTIYDMTNNFVANPINRYNIGSLAAGYKKAADGSMTLYIQKDSPGKDKESNWLPAPKGDFRLAFRTYGPEKEIVEQTWQIPGVVEVK